MDSTFIFSIDTLRTVNALNYTDYVIDITYKVSKTDAGVEGYYIGILKFDLPTDQTIIPYADLTEEVVVGWVQSSLTETDNQMIEGSILSMIDRLKNPAPNPTVTSLPWQS